MYFIYGMYDCLNLVCEAPGSAGCVLIRALEPVSGVELMRARRPAARKDEQLASGPGKLTLAMGITRELNGSSLITGPLQLRKMRKPEPFKISIGPRIGISQCADWPLRFYIQGNRFVSRGKPGKTSDAVEAL